MTPVRVCLLLLCLVSRSVAAQTRLPPRYPGTSPTAIGDLLVLGGEPHRLWYFLTEDELPKVARYFHRAWRAEGYSVISDGDLGSSAVLSVFDTRQGLQYAVVLSSHGKRTLGFQVIRDLWTRLDAKEAVPQGLPVLEGALFAEDLVDMGSASGGHSRSIVLALGLEHARQKVVAQLADEGFVQRRTTKAGGRGGPMLTLEHVRGAMMVMTTLSELVPGTTALLQTWSREVTR